MKRETVFITVVLALISAILYIAFRQAPATTSARQGGRQEEALYVTRVIDGDTIALSDGRRVRLIGIDTPEFHYSKKLLRDARRDGRDIQAIQAMGRRAMEFTKSLCLGKEVRLEYDVDRTDRYGRALAYVRLKDGLFLNEEIIKGGYAQIMTVPPNVKYAEAFLRLEREARAGGKGLWRN